MKKSSLAAAAAVLAGVMAFTTTPIAAPMHLQHAGGATLHTGGPVLAHRGGAVLQHAGWRGGGWHGGFGGWGGGWGWGFAPFAGLLGFGLGAAIASRPYYGYPYYGDYGGYGGYGGYAGDGGYGDGHVQACLARYRSYDPASDTFLGYDGYRHYCML